MINSDSFVELQQSHSLFIHRTAQIRIDYWFQSSLWRSPLPHRLPCLLINISSLVDADSVLIARKAQLQGDQQFLTPFACVLSSFFFFFIFLHILFKLFYYSLRLSNRGFNFFGPSSNGLHYNTSWVSSSPLLIFIFHKVSHPSTFYRWEFCQLAPTWIMTPPAAEFQRSIRTENPTFYWKMNCKKWRMHFSQESKMRLS